MGGLDLEKAVELHVVFALPGEGEAEREVADQKVDGAAAGQTEPGPRTQPHAGRAPRHR